MGNYHYQWDNEEFSFGNICILFEEIGPRKLILTEMK